MKRIIIIYFIVFMVVIVALIWLELVQKSTTTVYQSQVEKKLPEELPTEHFSHETSNSNVSLDDHVSSVNSSVDDMPPPDMNQLVRGIIKGDASARAEAISIAKNSSNKIEMRRAAILALSNDKTPQTFAALFDLLSDPNKGIRATALYALPKAKRPTNYDYTSEPTPEQLLELDREKTKLLGEP